MSGASRYRPSVGDVELDPVSTPPALHKAIVWVDIERFTDPSRVAQARLAMREGLYGSLKRAFVESKIPWDNCYHEDRGDGAFILVHTDVPQARLVEPLPFELAAELGRHNHAHEGSRIRLRVAMNAGYVRHDPEGVDGAPLDLTFRLLDAAELRTALREATGDLAFIASDEFYREVIRHRHGFDPSTYRRVRVTNKQTESDAWIWTSEVQVRAGQAFGEGVARIETALTSVDSELAKAREDRAVIDSKISSPVPDIPDLAAELRARLVALNTPRKDRRWAELISDVTELERAADEALDEARAAGHAVHEPLDRRQELRGLLRSYQVMAREDGRVENPDLDELYRRAYDLLWTAPCDLAEAETATMRYVRAVQEESAT
jgi:hypothetical protein